MTPSSTLIRNSTTQSQVQSYTINQGPRVPAVTTQIQLLPEEYSGRPEWHLGRTEYQANRKLDSG